MWMYNLYITTSIARQIEGLGEKIGQLYFFVKIISSEFKHFASFDIKNK